MFMAYMYVILFHANVESSWRKLVLGYGFLFDSCPGGALPMMDQESTLEKMSSG